MRDARCVLSAAIILVGTGTARAGEEGWELVLTLPPEAEADGNAWVRWRPNLDAVAGLSEADVAILAAGEAAEVDRLAQRFRDAVDSVWLREGEHVSLPRPRGPEGAVSDASSLRRLAVLCAAGVRRTWQAGSRERAVAIAADLVAAGGEIADDACSVAGFLAGVSVVDAGVESAAWICAQSGRAGCDLRSLGASLSRTEAALVAGVENALRGEFHLVFRVVLERMPRSNDPAVLLERLSTFGVDHGRTGGEPTAAAANAPARAWLDPVETQAIYGRALSAFIREQRQDGQWKPDRFGGPWRERVGAWMDELGPLGHHAFHGDSVGLTEETRAAIEAMPPTVDNPFGKLLLVMFVVDVDGIAGAGYRARERVIAARAGCD